MQKTNKCTQPINETECSKNQMAWSKENNKPNNISRKKKTIPHEWRPPSPEEFGKRVIHGKPYTWNNNGSWKTDATPDSGLTPEDAAAATAIATAINNTFAAKQRTSVGAANASITSKALKFPTTIGENDDGGTAVTEITTQQDQINEITRINANLGNQFSDIISKLSRE